MALKLIYNISNIYNTNIVYIKYIYVYVYIYINIYIIYKRNNLACLILEAKITL